MGRKWMSSLRWSLAVLGLLAGPTAFNIVVGAEPSEQSGAQLCERCGRIRPPANVPNTPGQYRSHLVCPGCGQETAARGEEQSTWPPSYGTGYQSVTGLPATGCAQAAYPMAAGAAMAPGVPGAVGAPGTAGASP